MTLAEFVFGFADKFGILILTGISLISVPICIKITDSDDTAKLGKTVFVVLPIAIVLFLLWLIPPVSHVWGPPAAPLALNLYFLFAKLINVGLEDHRRARRDAKLAEHTKRLREEGLIDDPDDDTVLVDDEDDLDEPQPAADTDHSTR